MTAFAIRDTHKIVQRLQAKGFTATQAEAITDAISQIDAEDVATKNDLNTLRADLYKYIFGASIAQIALIVGLLQILK